MFAFGVPVPGTINAVAARLTAAVSAIPTPRTTELSIPRTNNSAIRAHLRMCQRSHKGVAPVGGTRKLIAHAWARLSDLRGAVRRRGREWNRRVLLTSGR